MTLSPNLYDNEFTRMLGIDFPVICGAMYPCSNPELVAAASEAGGIGIVQPISLTYVYGYDYRDGLSREDFVKAASRGHEFVSQHPRR